MKQYKALTMEVDLSGLGKEQWIQEELDYDTIAQKIIDTLIDVMREKDVEASSNLIQSLEPETKNGEIVIYADYYWKFIDKGVNGLMQSRDSEFSFKFIPASKNTHYQLQSGLNLEAWQLNLQRWQMLTG